MTKMKVSFLGLGVMGYPMAGHLVSAGFDVTVFNRTTQKAKQWVEKNHNIKQVSRKLYKYYRKIGLPV